MLPKNKPWGTWALVGVLVLVIGPMVLGALPAIFEETGASNTVSSAGHSAGAALPGIVGAVGTALLVLGGLWLLLKIVPRLLRGGGGGGGSKGGARALRNAQRDEFQAVADARAQGQREVHQARITAERKRDAAIRAAQARVAAEQDGWD